MCAAGISRPHRPALTGGLRSARARNAANLMIGSGMQQARKLQAEEAVEVVKNHVDGTGLSRWTLGSRSAAGTSRRSGRQERCRWRGERCAFRSAGRDTQTNPRRAGHSDQGDRPVLQSGVKAMRVRAGRIFGRARARSARDLAGEPGNRQSPRRSRESPTTRSSSSAGDRHPSKGGWHATSPEGQINRIGASSRGVGMNAARTSRL